MIVCRVLGPVEVVLDGGVPPAELLWRKNLALLLYLARSPRRGRSREHLLGLLWADRAQSKARHSLNEAVRVLRRAAGETALDTSEGRVRLEPGVVQLDVDLLESQAAQGDWCSAAALVAGEFMEGFAVPDAVEFEDWLAAERAHWRHRGVEVLAHGAETLTRSGRIHESAEMARRAAALDPRSDLAVRALMRALALAGDRAGALERFDTFTARLKQELDAKPEAETIQLGERIRRERAPRPPAAAGGVPAERRIPLVGRGAELARMLDAAEACLRERRATAIVVEGEAGTGKTRLIEEAVARLRLDGVAVAAVRAVKADRADPWNGVRALARGGLLEARGLAAARPDALAAFAREIPEWSDRFAAAARETPLPLGRALGEVLRAAGEEQPVFLVADDAEWLDRESLLALVAALRDLSGTALGVVLAVSSVAAAPDIDEVRSRVGRDFPGEVVAVGPLDTAALRALARELLPTFGDVEIDRVVRRVGTDSAGIPVLAVELLRAVALGMDLGATTGAWPQPFRTLDQSLPGDLPDAVIAALRVRFRQLSRTAQQVLAAASILDDRVTPDLLARGLALTVDEVLPALDELEWERWLVSDPRGYGFGARIVRQVIAQDMLTAGQRRRILERLGRAP